MKKFLGILTVIASLTAFQAEARKVIPMRSTASASSGQHYLSPLLGFAGVGANAIQDTVNGKEQASTMMLSGMFGLGVDYEYMMRDELSIGGLFRYYMIEDSIAQVSVKETALLIGGLAHLYFLNTDMYYGYVASGLTMMKLTQKQSLQSQSADYKPDMAFGFPFALGFGYKVTDRLGLGIEHMRVIALGEKVNGWPVSDFMFRVRIAL